MPRMRLLSKHKRYEAQCAAPVIHQVIYEMLPKLAQHTKYHLYFTFADRECQAFFQAKKQPKHKFRLFSLLQNMQMLQKDLQSQQNQDNTAGGLRFFFIAAAEDIADLHPCGAH